MVDVASLVGCEFVTGIEVVLELPVDGAAKQVQYQSKFSAKLCKRFTSGVP